MRLAFKQLTAALALLSLLMIALFGFAFMVHDMGGALPMDCPLSVLNGASMCPQNIQAVIMHHIAAYRTLFGVPMHGNLVLLFASLLVFGIPRSDTHTPSPPSLVTRRSPATSFFSPRGRKRARWLALFEHSPSTG